MGISFRYKPPETSTKPENPVDKDFNADLKYLSSKEELGLDLSSLDDYFKESATPGEVPLPESEEKPISASLLKLADLIKSELRALPPENPDTVRAQKVISLYEKRDGKAPRKQKGLQLKKVA